MQESFLLAIDRRIPIIPIWSGPVSDEDRFLAKSLETKRLVEKDYAFAYIFVAAFSVSGVVMFSIAQERAFSFLTRPDWVIAVIIILIAFIGVSFRAGFGRWKMTWLGCELASYASIPKRK